MEYIYFCTDCDKEIIINHPMKDDSVKSCPVCKSISFKRLIKPCMFVFKGSGWASKDIRANSLAKG